MALRLLNLRKKNQKLTRVKWHFQLLNFSKIVVVTSEDINFRLSINPVELKVGINSVKELKNGKVLIESTSEKDVELINNKINEHCGDELQSIVSKLRDPKIIIYNVPEEINLENAGNTIISQNAELNFENGDIIPKFIFKNKKNVANLVVEVKSQIRQKLKDTK